ncbi:tRNA (guanine(46)-N(7))-methyltransferase TrmB [Azospirillum picis]|uniref:tRNA (guanine-N(7)-)-methyltransferase n=1 Tax=Azospirillum picis TaxID=488438 RepID=A0ABU0MLP1_9PROT|nr:tRNA (guanine(46)-N(7))-methyltransferase TrmB [Azospirillum picis]MBP2300342.1 tRNA (guanine-N7-)-methyltransferase [Azospirillum picis]MDQ0534138.1 tRNA (guanine-N7-)-methyltransferase [Azospirillum picis]
MTDQPAPESSNRLFGRRKGRPLRKRRTELIDSLLPRLELPVPKPGDRVDPAGLFGGAVTDVWLEVGFGSGHHLAWQAGRNPDVGIIGAEPFVNGVAALLGMVDDDRLENVRVLPDDARPLLDALPDASIGRAFVLFADPWPKKRHADRRFVGPENLPRLARVLKDGAELRLASDDMGLVRWMLEHTVRHPDFEWTARGPSDWRNRPDDWPPTRYEEKAIAAGRKPVFLRFVRKPRG